MADDDKLVDDSGKTAAEGDPKSPPVALRTNAARNAKPKEPTQQGVLSQLADPDIWNSDAVKKIRAEKMKKLYGSPDN